MIKQFYAIKKGRKCGVIVKSWEECESLVSGYKGAIFKGFKWHEQAEKWLHEKIPFKQISKIMDDGTVFIPATDKKNKYGYYKPKYYVYRGFQMASYGMTIGNKCDVNNLYSGLNPPWE